MSKRAIVVFSLVILVAPGFATFASADGGRPTDPTGAPSHYLAPGTPGSGIVQAVLVVGFTPSATAGLPPAAVTYSRIILQLPAQLLPPLGVSGALKGVSICPSGSDAADNLPTCIPLAFATDCTTSVGAAYCPTVDASSKTITILLGIGGFWPGAARVTLDLAQQQSAGVVPGTNVTLSSIDWTTPTLNVPFRTTAGALACFTINAPSSARAGAGPGTLRGSNGVNVTVTAKASASATKDDYTGPVVLTTSDAQVPPESHNFTLGDGGIWTFNLTFHKAGTQTFTTSPVALCNASSIIVQPGISPSKLNITDSNGVMVTPQSLDTTRNLALFVQATDADGNTLASPPSVAWSVQGGIGRVSPQTGTSTIFDPTTPGVGSVSATAGTISATTGPIIVTPGTAASIMISDVPGGFGSPVGARTMTTDQPLPLFAGAKDADGNNLGPASVAWSVIGSCGTISPATGAATIFQPTTVGGSPCRVHAQSNAPAAGADTGPFTATPGMPTHMVIRIGTASGPIADSSTPATGQTVDLYARLSDAHEQDVASAMPTSWAVLGSCGQIGTASGSHATFIATAVTDASANCRVRAAAQEAPFPAPTSAGAQSFGPGLTYTGPFTVLASPLASVRLRTAPNGGGIPLASIAITTDELRSFWAAGYDAQGNYVGDQTNAAWTLSTQNFGVLDRASGANVTFTPLRPGTSSLTATVSGFTSTTSIVISPGQIASIQILDAASSTGLTVGAFTLDSNTNKALFAAGFDARQNFISAQSVTWSVNGGCGSLAPDQGTSTQFTAGYLPMSACTVHAAAGSFVNDTGLVTVRQPARDQLLIRTGPDGTGTPVGGLVVSADDTRTLYAAAYNTGHYLGDVPVTWTVTNGIGTISPTSPSASAVFNPTKVGTGVISATDGTLTASTGTIQVYAGALAMLSIESAADDRGSTIQSRSMAPQDTLQLYAVGRDADGNFVQMQTAAWTTDGPFGIVTPPVGSTATLTALRPGGVIVTAKDSAGRTASTAAIAIQGPVSTIRIELLPGGNTTHAEGLPLRAGDTQTLYAIGYDAAGKYAGPVSVLWSVQGGIGSVTPTSGLSTLFRAETVGKGNVTAIDAQGHADTTGNYTVSPGLRIASFSFDNVAPTQSACTAIPVIVSARDAFTNIKTDYGGLVRFTTTDPNATLPGQIIPGFDIFNSGTKSYNFQFNVSGISWLNVTDGLVNGTTGPITVTAGALSGFDIPSLANQTSRTPFALHVYAKDACKNTITNFAAPTTVTVDQGVITPTSLTFTGGHASPSASVSKAGQRNLTVTSSGVSTISAPFFVVPNPTVASIGIVNATGCAGVPVTARAVTPDTTGASARFFVNAYDADNNCIGAQSVAWSLSSSIGTLSPTTGNATTITPTTIGAANLMATSGAFTAQAALTNSLGSLFSASITTAPATVVSLAPFSISVSVFDKGGNVKTDSTATITLTSDDSAATTLATHTLVAADAGTFTFTGLTLPTARTTVVTATAGTATIATSIGVTPGAAAQLSLTCGTGCSPTPVAGALQTLNLKVQDASRNTVPTYAGAAPIVSGPSASPFGVAPVCTSSAYASGVATLSCTFAKAETFDLSATSGTLPTTNPLRLTVRPSVASTIVTILPGQTLNTATGLVGGTPLAATAGVAFPSTLIALDSFGNVATGYAGARDIVFTGTLAYDGKAPTASNFANADTPFGIPTNITFALGQASTNLTLFRAAAQTLSAADSKGTPTGVATALITVGANAKVMQLGILYADGVRCTNAQLAALSRACIVASKTVDGMQNPVTVQADTDVTFYSAAFDEWDNLIGPARATWLATNGDSLSNVPTFKQNLPPGSKEVITVRAPSPTASYAPRSSELSLNTP